MTKVKDLPNGTILTDPSLISEGIKQGVVEYHNLSDPVWNEGIGYNLTHIKTELYYGRTYRKCSIKKYNTKKPKPTTMPIAKQFSPVKMEIQKGSIKVKNAIKVASGPKLVAIEVNLKSKHAEYAGLMWSERGGEILLGANENTLWNDKRYKKDTYISFPEYKGWEFHSHSVSQYTLYVCLVKGNAK